MMKLGSEGVYLHEKCGTNPSRHLPGLKTLITNTIFDFWVSGGSVGVSGVGGMGAAP